MKEMLKYLILVHKVMYSYNSNSIGTTNNANKQLQQQTVTTTKSYNNKQLQQQTVTTTNSYNNKQLQQQTVTTTNSYNSKQLQQQTVTTNITIKYLTSIELNDINLKML